MLLFVQFSCRSNAMLRAELPRRNAAVQGAHEDSSTGAGKQQDSSDKAVLWQLARCDVGATLDAELGKCAGGA